VFNGASLLVIRAFFSLQEPWVATKVAALGLVLNLAGNAILYQPLGVPGIPLATSITSFVTFLVLLRLLGRQVGGLRTDLLLDGFGRCLAASAVLGVMSWATFTVLDGALGRSLPAQLVCVGGAMAAGTLAYLAAAQAFEVPELRRLARLARPLR
jgi:putative peptidoglycan lipid II flippase